MLTVAVDARKLMFPAGPDDVVYFRSLSDRIARNVERTLFDAGTGVVDDPWGVYATRWLPGTRYPRQPVFPG